MKNVFVSCSVLQCVAVCCSVLQCKTSVLQDATRVATVWWSTLQGGAVRCKVAQYVAAWRSVLQCTWCMVTMPHEFPSVLQYVEAYCSMLQRVVVHQLHGEIVTWVPVACEIVTWVATGCSMLQSGAACCSVLQCVAIYLLHGEDAAWIATVFVS